MNEPWCNDVSSYRARLLEMVPADQLPFAEFELRMLITTLETDHLRDIHTNWRPIADERNQLRAQLAAVPTEPLESRRGARNKYELLQKQFDDLMKKYVNLQGSTPEDDSPRFKALSVEYSTLQRNHAGLRERHQTLQDDYSTLETKYKELQVACGETEA